MFKLTPAVKDYIWGGTRLHTRYGKPMPGERLAESWEISCHPDGPCIIASGPQAGISFAEYWEEGHTEDFPILVKLIDAAEPLSVQVHPDDAYAARLGEHGKTEMWLILDAGPDSSLYYGLEHAISQEELAQRIADGSLPEVLRSVPVKPGDVFYIPAGTIHAIGAGILLAEVQQSSNLTYRIYDYGRGRPLHVEDALAVTKTGPTTPQALPEGGNPRLLCRCDYFTAWEYRITEEAEYAPPAGSFAGITLLDGNAVFTCDGEALPCRSGESLFLPEDSPPCTIAGNCRFLIVEK